MDKEKIAIIGTGEAGSEVARRIAAMDMKPLVMDKPTPPTSKEEELKKVDPKLQEAHAALSEYDKVMVSRGYKTFKKRKGEYILVDNNPYEKRVAGPKFTAKKKKRKK